MKTFTCLAALTLFALSPASAVAGAQPQPAAPSAVPEPTGQRSQPGTAAPSQKPTIRFDKTWTSSPNKAIRTSPEPVRAADTPARSGSTTAPLPPTPAVPRQADLARSGRPVPERSQRPAMAHRSLRAARKRRAMKTARSGTPSPLDQLIGRVARRSYPALPERSGSSSPAEPAPAIGSAQPLPHRSIDENTLPAPSWQAHTATRRPVEEFDRSGPEGAAAEWPRRPLSWEERGFPPGPSGPRVKTVIEGGFPPFAAPPPPPPRYRYGPAAGLPYSPRWPRPFPNAEPPP